MELASTSNDAGCASGSHSHFLQAHSISEHTLKIMSACGAPDPPTRCKRFAHVIARSPVSPGNTSITLRKYRSMRDTHILPIVRFNVQDSGAAVHRLACSIYIYIYMLTYTNTKQFYPEGRPSSKIKYTHVYISFCFFLSLSLSPSLPSTSTGIR